MKSAILKIARILPALCLAAVVFVAGCRTFGEVEADILENAAAAQAAGQGAGHGGN